MHWRSWRIGEDIEPNHISSVTPIMKTLITFSLLLCGKLVCAQQDTIVLDSCTIKKYQHNYHSLFDPIPDYVQAKLNTLSTHNVYRTYCALDEFTLANGNRVFLFAINEKNYDCTISRTDYYLATNDVNNVDVLSDFFIYDLFSVEAKGLIKNTFNSAKLINGQFLHLFGENNVTYSVNDLFQPGLVPIVTPFTGDYWSGITLYDGPIVSINWNPEWFTPISCIWGPTLGIFELPKANSIPPTPFDFNGYFSGLNKEGFFSSILTLPYVAVFENTEYLERGCFELSEVLLSGKLKEATKVVEENKEA